jgi:hypothetical protein
MTTWPAFGRGYPSILPRWGERSRLTDSYTSALHSIQNTATAEPAHSLASPPTDRNAKEGTP